MDDEENNRLTKASAAIGRFNRNVCIHIYIYIYVSSILVITPRGLPLFIFDRNTSYWRSVSEATKIKVYRPVVFTTLLYGYQTWTTYQRHIKKLSYFHMTHQRKMAKTQPRHRSFNLGFSSQHLDAITTSLGQLRCPHERFPPSEETNLRRTVSGQALPKMPGKALQRYTEGLHDFLRHRP